MSVILAMSPERANLVRSLGSAKLTYAECWDILKEWDDMHRAVAAAQTLLDLLPGHGPHGLYGEAMQALEAALLPFDSEQP